MTTYKKNGFITGSNINNKKIFSRYALEKSVTMFIVYDNRI